MTEPRWRLRRLTAALCMSLVVFGGWRLVRDSPLVAVDDVTIEGVSGPQADAIRRVLTRAAGDQTTLHVQEDKLREAVRAYPSVRGLRTERDLLHGLTIYVSSYDPIIAVAQGSSRVAVASDGTLLRGAPTDGLGLLQVRRIGGGRSLEDREGMRVVGLLAAAPPPLRSRVARVFRSRRGLGTMMRNGPKLYFGSVSRPAAKWAAASKVLSDSGSLGASYIDVRLPERPTAGGLPAQPPEPSPTQAPPTIDRPSGVIGPFRSGGAQRTG